jgi:hypothetical protein
VLALTVPTAALASERVDVCAQYTDAGNQPMDLSSTKRQTASIIVRIGGDGTDQEGRFWEISA